MTSDEVHQCHQTSIRDLIVLILLSTTKASLADTLDSTIGVTGLH